MNRAKAHRLLTSISRSYDLAIRAECRAVALRGKTAKALAERDKAIAYVEKAIDAEMELRDLIDNS
jgi:hypothetical protein